MTQHGKARSINKIRRSVCQGLDIKIFNTYDNFLLQLMAKFTVESLQMWQFAPNSIHYLLSLWQRMVASVPYVKATEPHLLETYTPEVTQAYIRSRLESVSVVIR